MIISDSLKGLLTVGLLISYLSNNLMQMCSSLSNACQIIAPILTGALFCFIGFTGIIVIDIVTFIIAVMIIYTNLFLSKKQF